MFDPERATWTEQQFRTAFEELNQELVHESSPDWDARQLVIAQMMTELGRDFLECFECVCGEWVARGGKRDDYHM